MRCKNCGWPNDDNAVLCVKCKQNLTIPSLTIEYKPAFDSYYAIEAICYNCGHWQNKDEIVTHICPKCKCKCVQLQTVSKSRWECKCPACGYRTHNDVSFCPHCGTELERCRRLLPEDHWNVDIPSINECLPSTAADYIFIRPLNDRYLLNQDRTSRKVGVVNRKGVLMTDIKYDSIEPFRKYSLPGPEPLPPESEWLVGAFYKDGNDVGLLVEDSLGELLEYIR